MSPLPSLYSVPCFLFLLICMSLALISLHPAGSLCSLFLISITSHCFLWSHDQFGSYTETLLVTSNCRCSPSVDTPAAPRIPPSLPPKFLLLYVLSQNLLSLRRPSSSPLSFPILISNCSSNQIDFRFEGCSLPHRTTHPSHLLHEFPPSISLVRINFIACSLVLLPLALPISNLPWTILMWAP